MMWTARYLNFLLKKNILGLPAKMEAYVETLFLLTQPKEGQQFKNKKQPELTENRTVSKSDNQGVKEDTFIQTDRRDGDTQLGREDSQQNGGWRTLQSHISTQISQEEQSGSKSATPRLQHQEIKLQTTD